ncbi:DUF3054 domain-containing protein [Jiangella anatolica]|uniref:DUF3054 domain-containing protein n=1 Tax=Jiangella anatolica TaxID=2670374 RepID=A0A2W2CDE7_9ACTN|nr:DUF3054 domain-containing protein [Jiangella anatolica]PZF83706.1 DUF3054 domain-containing protein [Jiangella anatolica]
MSRWAAVAADAVLVLVFVLIGRRTHDDPLALAGVARTAWPFLAGLAVGWAVTLLGAPRGREDAGPARPRGWLAAGVTVWAATVIVGMLLRAASGQGTAASFVVVATVVLGALLVGWRLVAALTGRRRFVT